MCSIKGRPYPGLVEDDVYCRRLLLPNIRVLHKGSSISGARAWRILPLGTRVGLASESQAGWSLYWGLSIQQWKETVLKQLNFYSIEEHFFFGMLILIFCVFGSNRNVDVRSEQDDRQSNTMFPHC